ncbi:MAG: GNAT family N-acetyltransferase [Patescibacteria group bacterium]
MKIRKARETDIPSILRLVKKMVVYHRTLNKIYKPYQRYTGLKKYFKEIIQTRNSILLVAEDNDAHLVGFLEGGVEKTSNELIFKKIGMVYDIFVEEKYRQREIGQKLLNFALRYFNSKKIKYMQVNVEANNNVGKKFWKKNNFFEYQIKLLKKLK